MAIKPEEFELLRVLLDQNSNNTYQDQYSLPSKEAGASFQNFLGKHTRANTIGNSSVSNHLATHSGATEFNPTQNSGTKHRPPSTSVNKTIDNRHQK